MISVIVPVYNTANFLERCIKSILKQSFGDIEIVCIDDGSTDNSLSILKNFAKKDSRIKAIHQENKGLSNARNKGLNCSIGEYILFVDSDDELENNAIQNLYNGIIHGNVDAAVGEIRLIFDNNLDKSLEYQNYFKLKYSGIYELNDNIINDFYVCACGIMYKREIVNKLKLCFPDKLFFEDNYWHWTYFSSVKKINFIKEYVYRYYIHSNSIMSQTFMLQEGRSVHQLYVVEEILNFWNKHHKLNDHKLAAISLIEKMFFEAIKYCLNYEKALMAYECARIIKKYNLNVQENNILRKVEEGNLRFLYIDVGENENSRNNYILYLRFLKVFERLFPKNSKRKKIAYTILRKIYKKLFKI